MLQARRLCTGSDLPPGYIVPPACSSSARLPVSSSPGPEPLPDVTQPSATEGRRAEDNPAKVETLSNFSSVPSSLLQLRR
ncbi:hypothetical protein D4764_16G0001840 [Takifugu flavidus]|uniref:Uncharacterized protein n=1 Tax=Takifugu flavidus TaxID=433684 RepID=A0A5C6P0T8_9TELE|nr:hypothetical protein D4764_16G0001840 [Takifugu flavidus]